MTFCYALAKLAADHDFVKGIGAVEALFIMTLIAFDFKHKKFFQQYTAVHNG